MVMVGILAVVILLLVTILLEFSGTGWMILLVVLLYVLGLSLLLSSSLGSLLLVLVSGLFSLSSCLEFLQDLFCGSGGSQYS